MLIRPTYRPLLPSLGGRYAAGIIDPAPFAQNPPAVGPALWLPFDNGSFNDFSGLNNPVSPVNSPIIAGGFAKPINGPQRGGAAFVSASSQSLHTGVPTLNSTALAFYTISLWVKRTSSAATFKIAVCSNSGPVYVGTDSTNSNWVVNSNGSQTSNYHFDLNNWHHLCAVKTISTMNLYVDGVLQTSVADTGATDWTAMFVGSFQGNSFGWDGSLDDVRLYTRSLEPAEVLALYSEQFQPTVDIETIALQRGPVVMKAFQGRDIYARTALTKAPLAQFTNAPATNRYLRAGTYAGVPYGFIPYTEYWMGTIPAAAPPPSTPITSFHREWQSAVLSAWQPPDPLPTIPNKLNPSITAVRVDNPPFNLRKPQPPYPPDFVAPQVLPDFNPSLFAPAAPHLALNRGWLSGVMVAWQPPDPQPQWTRQLNPSITAVRVDNPPFGLKPWQPIPVQDPQQPQAPRYRQIISVAPAAYVPYAPAWVSVVMSWQPPDPAPQYPKLLNASLKAVRVDNPPFNLPPDWQPLPAPDQGQPQLPRLMSPALIAPPAVVYVPRASPWLSAVIQAWQPADPAPQLPGKLTPPSVDNPPFGLRSWQPLPAPDAPTPQQPRYPAITGVPVVYVPFNQAWMSSVIRAWQRPDPAAQWTRQLNPQITAVRVDNPPPFHLDHSAVRAWWDMPPGMPIMRPTTLPPQAGLVAYIQTVVSSPAVHITVGAGSARFKLP